MNKLTRNNRKVIEELKQTNETQVETNLQLHKQNEDLIILHHGLKRKLEVMEQYHCDYPCRKKQRVL